VSADGRPAQYKAFITNRFAFREVIAPLAVELAAHEDVEVAPAFTDEPDTVQDRRGCCGTMQKAEYLGEEEHFEHEVAELEAALAAEAEAESKPAKRGSKR
jgi:hypothetical protein